MPLRAGFTQFHGLILNCVEAQKFRRMERNIRRHIDNGFEAAASYWLNECQMYASDHKEYQHLCGLIQKDAADRWLRRWGKRSQKFRLD